MASRPSKFDFGRTIWSEPGQRDMASRPTNFDFWWEFQSEPGQSAMASRDSKFDFLWWDSKLVRVRRVARGIESLGDWKVVAETLNCHSHSVTAEKSSEKVRASLWSSLLSTTQIQKLIGLLASKMLHFSIAKTAPNWRKDLGTKWDSGTTALATRWAVLVTSRVITLVNGLING